MNLEPYLNARLAAGGPVCLGRPLPPVRFGHVELLARVGSPFAAHVTGATYREPSLGDLLLALEILRATPWSLPTVNRLWWLKLRHGRLTEGARLDACNALAAHFNAAIATPRFWTEGTGAGGDGGVPWLLSLAVCQMAKLHVTDAELIQKPMQLVIQQCFAVWASEQKLKLITAADEAAREANRALRRRGPTPEDEAVFAHLARLNGAKAKGKR